MYSRNIHVWSRTNRWGLKGASLCITHNRPHPWQHPLPHILTYLHCYDICIHNKDSSFTYSIRVWRKHIEITSKCKHHLAHGKKTNGHKPLYDNMNHLLSHSCKESVEKKVKQDNMQSSTWLTICCSVSMSNVTFAHTKSSYSPKPGMDTFHVESTLLAGWLHQQENQEYTFDLR